MDTQRFDALTVTLAKGESRRRVLRGLVGGVLGAAALGHSGALAKNDKGNGGGQPITIENKPFCRGGDVPSTCPVCYDAAAACCEDHTDATTCDPAGCETDNLLLCAGLNNNTGSCVTARCENVNGRLRCRYDYGSCPEGGPGFCCRRYESTQFGQCVANKKAC